MREFFRSSIIAVIIALAVFGQAPSVAAVEGGAEVSSSQSGNQSISQSVSQSAAQPESQRAAQTKLKSFSSVYEEILARSLRVQTQRLVVESRRESRLARWGAFTPSISLEGSSRKGGEPATPEVRSAVVSATANLFRSGGDIAGLKASSRDLESSRQSLLTERQVAEEEAAQSLIGVIARNRQTRIINDILKLKVESFRIARERYSKGLLPLQEVDKVSIEVENSRARLSDAETSEAEARATLQTLLGTSAFEIEWPWKELIAKGPKLEATPFDIEKRPDWRAALMQQEAERFRKRQSISGLLPSINLSASYGNMDLSQSDRRDWSTVLTLSVQLFDGLRGWTAHRIQGYAEETANIRVESIRRQAPNEVESLRLSLKVARESALIREKTAEVSQRLYSDNLQRFRLGRASVNELALDQNRLLESQLLEVEGWSNAHLSFIRLCHALGGFVSGLGECQREAPPL